MRRVWYQGIASKFWSNMRSLDLRRFLDTGILISPYFDGFTSLQDFSMYSSGLYAIDKINLPPSVKYLEASNNRLPRFPNVSSSRFPFATILYIGDNDINNIADTDIADVSSMITTLSLDHTKLVELGYVTAITALRVLWLDNNQLETIPDMPDRLPHLTGLTIADKTRMTCDHRMCWGRSWDRLPLMGPTWGPSGADRTQVGPMLAPWTLLLGTVPTYVWRWCRVQSFTCC